MLIIKSMHLINLHFCTYLVSLARPLFQPASNQVETVEKPFARLCRVRTSPRSYGVSTKNGWKNLLSIKKRHLKQLKPAAVGTVDPNRTQS